jgi:hypothetical protein
MIAEEALGTLEEIEGVADFLPIVDELGLVEPAKPGQAKQAMGIPHLKHRRLAKENGRGVQQGSVTDQTESDKKLLNVAGCRLFQTLAPDRFLHRAHNLGMVEVFQRNPGCGLILPAAGRVHALQQLPVVKLLRHGRRGRSIPEIAAAGIRERPAAACNLKNQDRLSRRQRDRFHFRECRRLDLPLVMDALFSPTKLSSRVLTSGIGQVPLGDSPERRCCSGPFDPACVRPILVPLRKVSFLLSPFSGGFIVRAALVVDSHFKTIGHIVRRDFLDGVAYLYTRPRTLFRRRCVGEHAPDVMVTDFQAAVLLGD